MLAVEKAAFRSLRANLGAVLGNTFQAKKAFRKENTEYLLHQILHCTAVSHPEITQRVVIYYLDTGQPFLVVVNERSHPCAGFSEKT